MQDRDKASVQNVWEIANILSTHLKPNDKLANYWLTFRKLTK